MIRYLDYNDGYTSRVSGHPSDNIAAVLASAEAAGADGWRVIAATVLAYEMYCRFSDVVDILPFDHATLDCIASGLASAYLFGLPPERMADALNLAITPNLALHQPRIDVLSHWKACAAANACRNAVFATMLAARGLTGPRLAFEGAEGYFNTVSKGESELAPFGGPGRPFKIMECSIKRFPLGQYSQTVVQAALEVREKLPDVRDIAEVRIRTLQKAITIMAGDPQKWRPTTRETADHSMVYTTGVALMHGTVHQRHFGDEYPHQPRAARPREPHQGRGLRGSQPARARGHAVRRRGRDPVGAALQRGGRVSQGALQESADRRGSGGQVPVARRRTCSRRVRSTGCSSGCGTSRT